MENKKLSRKDYIKKIRKDAENKSKFKIKNKSKVKVDNRKPVILDKSYLVPIRVFDISILVLASIAFILGFFLLLFTFMIDGTVNESGGYKTMSEFMLSQDAVKTSNLNDDIDDYNYLSGNNLNLQDFTAQVLAGYVGLMLIGSWLIIIFNILSLILSIIILARSSNKYKLFKSLKFSIIICILSLFGLNIINVILGIILTIFIKKHGKVYKLGIAN